MKKAAALRDEKRPYKLGARALSAEQTAERILDAFAKRIATDWFDQITLEQIARDADVAVPTIIRHFGGKEGVLEATWERMSKDIVLRRAVACADPAAAIDVIVTEYELMGDLVMRALAQEDRHPAFKAPNDAGRAYHRGWVEGVFAPWLDAYSGAARRRKVDALVSATDLYLWRLVRRDMGRSAQHLKAVMLDLVVGVLGSATPPQPSKEKRA